LGKHRSRRCSYEISRNWRFEAEIKEVEGRRVWAVRWYCRYGISYRELEEMMGERGDAVGSGCRMEQSGLELDFALRAERLCHRP
jgi:hypothetical protein